MVCFALDFSLLCLSPTFRGGVLCGLTLHNARTAAKTKLDLRMKHKLKNTKECGQKLLQNTAINDALARGALSASLFFILPVQQVQSNTQAPCRSGHTSLAEHNLVPQFTISVWLYAICKKDRPCAVCKEHPADALTSTHGVSIHGFCRGCSQTFFRFLHSGRRSASTLFLPPGTLSML